jgi:hypothetical protein
LYNQEAVLQALPLIIFAVSHLTMHFQFFSSWRLWAILCLLGIARLTWFDAAILFAPDSLRIQYIPDDAFYYLQLAKNFPRFLTWTFDAGVSVTSGFHLVNAYALSALYTLLPLDTNTFINIGLVWSSGLTLAVLLLAWTIGWRKKSALYFLILLWLTGTKNFTFNSVSITEWAIVVLTGMLYALALRKYWNDTRPRVLFLLFVLGIFGSLARSDFGLFPFGLFAASAMLAAFTRQRIALAQLMIGLAGAGFGVAIVFLHNHFFTGEWVQSSALMKAYWAQLYPIPFLAAISLPPHVLGFNIEGAAEQIAFCFLSEQRLAI